jgi:hypothetical protein
MQNSTLKSLPYSPLKRKVIEMYPREPIDDIKKRMISIIKEHGNNINKHYLNTKEFLQLINEIGVPANYSSQFTDGCSLNQRFKDHNIINDEY